MEEADSALFPHHQRGVAVYMPGSHVSDEVEHRAAGAAGVVEVGSPISEAWAQVQDRHSCVARHPAVSVSCARDHVLVQAKDSSNRGV